MSMFIACWTHQVVWAACVCKTNNQTSVIELINHSASQKCVFPFSHKYFVTIWQGKDAEHLRSYGSGYITSILVNEKNLFSRFKDLHTTFKTVCRPFPDWSSSSLCSALRISAKILFELKSPSPTWGSPLVGFPRLRLPDTSTRWYFLAVSILGVCCCCVLVPYCLPNM